MYKRTFTYTDYDGVERTEDFYFNLTKAELIEMELGKEGRLTTMLDRIVKAKDNVSLIKEFKELIRKSYGKKSDDGRRFMKSDEIFDEFSQTEAYSMFFTELSTDDEAAAKFVNGIMPKDLAEQLDKETLVQTTAKTLNVVSND